MAGLNDLAGGGKLSAPSLSVSVGGTSNKELMASARLALSGNWGRTLLGCILFLMLVISFYLFVLSVLLLMGVSSSATTEDFLGKSQLVHPFFWVLHFLVAGSITVGFVAFFLGIVQEGEARFEKLFVGFRRYFQSLAGFFFYSLFIVLWSLLLVVPGIIAAFRYAMVFFILADDEDCGPLEALGRSNDMMKGNTWKLFCLNLRFIGWSILAAIPCGLGYIWLLPYMQTSYAKFYEDVS